MQAFAALDEQVKQEKWQALNKYFRYWLYTCTLRLIFNIIIMILART